MGATLSFGQIDDASRALAAYFQSLGLDKGDRVAVMMPNVFQYPVAVAAVLRAGLVVVNVNPLYTPRELEHQFEGLRRQGHRHPRELRGHAAAGHGQRPDQARRAGLDGRDGWASRRA